MMLYTTTLLKMKTAMNARFFRNTFPNSSPSNKVENKDMAFNQLWTGIKMGGIESYRLSFLIAVFILLITSCIFIIKFFLTNNPNNRGYDEFRILTDFLEYIDCLWNIRICRIELSNNSGINKSLIVLL